MDSYIAQLMEENKYKPAMLSTKLFLLSKTDEEMLLGLNKHLYEKLEQLSETDSGAEFRDLYDFALRISSNNNKGNLFLVTSLWRGKKNSSLFLSIFRHTIV